MANSLTPRLDTLPTRQRRLWSALGAVPSQFTLYGGTAIALQLGHRTSVDFDFFAPRSFTVGWLIARLPLLRAAELVQSARNTASFLISGRNSVKVSFFGVPGLGRLDRPLRAADTGLRVASLRDLAGTKVSVVQMRSEAKDYLDLVALIEHGIELSTALAAARAIYGRQFNAQNALKALVYFDDGDLSTLRPSARKVLRDAVRGVDLDNLPTLEPVRKPRTMSDLQR
jgi:hypothetical protein